MTDMKYNISYREAMELYKKYPKKGGNLYEERDIDGQGQFYTDHVMAMTSEDLRSKSMIAAELAYRDIVIAQAFDDVETFYKEAERLKNKVEELAMELAQAQKIALDGPQ